MTATPDRYGEWDAAYVLGALSPEERREFEEHLSGCAGCQQGVSEFAGIPGLLGQVAPEDAAVWSAAARTEEMPETLLPRMITSINRRRRRILVAVGTAAAAVVLLVGALTVGPRLLPGGNEPQRLAFTPVVASSMTALVDLVPVAEGTSVRVECQYGEVNEVEHGAAYDRYSIFVVARSGGAVDVKDWSAKPNKVMRPQGLTPLPVSQIERVEIRKATTGETLLTAIPR